jgi:hypothetical protein
MLLMVLLWSEPIGSLANTIFFNKASAADLYRMREPQDVGVLLAGHGGEEEGWCVLVSTVLSTLSAGLGGEGEGSCSSWLLYPLLRSTFLA